jgi:hypothetical protein
LLALFFGPRKEQKEEHCAWAFAAQFMVESNKAAKRSMLTHIMVKKRGYFLFFWLVLVSICQEFWRHSPCQM